MSLTSPPFAMLSLWSALGVPSTKIPIDGTTFVSHVLPPLVFYFVVAVLVVTPQTHTIRLALWPVGALLALRAALSVDMSAGESERIFLNLQFVMFLCSVAIRTLDWTLPKEPLVRHLRPANSSPSTILDALDLALNVRGIGWEWSRGLRVPRETRPANRIPFVFRTLLSMIAHTLIRVAFHQATLTLAPLGAGPAPGGSTIFDNTLPLLVRYLRASVISTSVAITIYATMQMSYDMYTILGVLIFRQDPAQWPPVFDAPWFATSLGDFWGRRWHQLLYHTFIFCSYPLSLVLGRAGTVIGAFLISAALHHAGLVALNSHIESWWMLIGFGMMGPGVVVEKTFYQLTGRRVGGVAGWFWMMTWLLLLGNVIVEGFARAGMFGYVDFVHTKLSAWIPVEHLVASLDGWLHTI